MTSRRMLLCAGAIVLASGGLTACPQEPHYPPASLKQYPHATDRYVRLMDKELSDTTYEMLKPDVRATDCEFDRLLDAFGMGEGNARAQAVLDSFQRHDAVRMDRLNRLSGGHTETAPGCARLNAAADSTDPLPSWPHK